MRMRLWHRIRYQEVRSAPMAEEFLEAQLKRIREMTEQFSRVRPLYDYRDATISYEEKGAAHVEPAPGRKHTRTSSRRRGR
jgi:hypothetical protein